MRLRHVWSDRTRAKPLTLASDERLVATYTVAYAILQESALSRLLMWKPLAYLGQRSYGAYLLHFLAIRIVSVVSRRDRHQRPADGLFLSRNHRADG